MRMFAYRVTLLLLTRTWFADGHVPTYGGTMCTENCCTPPHVHTWSQVFYLKGSGGIEVHVDDDSTPFDTLNGEKIDIDAVFRDEVDQTTYDLFVGCGGCVPSEDPVRWDTRVAYAEQGYEPAEIEPFTQTTYRSVFPGKPGDATRQYDSTGLKGVNCADKHFTIRLVDHLNRTDGEPIVWGAVIGRGEDFTFMEYVSFPLYVLLNHGSVWNDLWWTFPIWLILGPLLVVYGEVFVRLVCKWRTLNALSVQTVYGDDDFANEKPSELTFRHVDPREVMYQIAITAFVVAAGEELTHLLYAQFWFGAPIKYQFGVGLGVIFVSQIVPILMTTFIWHAFRYRRLWSARSAREWKQEWRLTRAVLLCWHGCRTCSGSPWWFLLEVPLGFMYLIIWFGAGFWVGAVAVIIGAVLRAYETTGRVAPTGKRYVYRSGTEQSDPNEVMKYDAACFEVTAWTIGGDESGDDALMPPSPVASTADLPGLYFNQKV